MYKDSEVARARKRRPTPTSDDNSYFSENNYGGKNIPETIKGRHHSILWRIRKRIKRRRNRGCSSHWLVPEWKRFTRHHFSARRWRCSRMRYIGRRFPKSIGANYFFTWFPIIIVSLNNPHSIIRTEWKKKMVWTGLSKTAIFLKWSISVSRWYKME